MQNTKIQALWQLCQELKNRREVLVEKMHQNQAYLDEQQWAMSTEVQQLKQENEALFAQVHQLIEETHHLRERLNNPPPAPEPEVPDYQADDLNRLHERYTQLANQLDVSDSLYQSRSALIEQLQKTHQNVHYEFKALKDSNRALVDDLQALQSKTNQLIELVENYRQAAREAYAEVEKIQAAQQQATEHEEEAVAETNVAPQDESFDSKAEAVRDAVRKKIVLLLRHRMGKVPRHISTALKEVSSNKAMDTLFEFAMTSETLDEFSDYLI